MNQRQNSENGQLAASLDSIRRLIVRRRLIRVCIAALGVFAVCGAIVAAVETRIPIREGWSFAAVAAAVSCAGVFLALGLFRVLAYLPRLTQLAEKVEKTHPEFMDSFICSVELESRPDQDQKPLEKALIEETHRKARGLDLRRLVFPPHLKWARLLGIMLPFVILTVGIIHSKTMLKARYFFNDLLHGERSGIVISTARDAWPVHSDIGLDIDILRWEKRGHIIYEDSEGTHRFKLNRTTEGNHSFTFYDVTGDTRFRITTPSLVSRWQTVKTYTPPRFKTVEMRVNPPDYTRQSTKTFPELKDCSAVVGSRIEIVLDLAPGVTPEFLSKNTSAGFTENTQGRWTTEFVLAEDTAFELKLSTEEGWTTNSGKTTVKARPDCPPIVEELVPGRDTQCGAETKVELEARAGDDFGLRRVALSYAISGGKRRETELYSASLLDSSKSSAEPVTDTTVRHLLDLAELDVKDGDVVAYFFVARDTREPDPQSARSEVHFIVIRPKLEQQDCEAEGEQENLDISALISEAKRLIRFTWDTIGAAPDERKDLEQKLVLDLKELLLETTKKINEVLDLAGGPNPVSQLLEQAELEFSAGVDLASRKLLEESLQHQERGLSRLIEVENELLKNTMKGKKGKKGQEGGEKPEGDREEEESPAGSREENLAALRELMERLRRLAEGQGELNRNMQKQSTAGTAVARGLSQKQKALEETARDLSKNLAKIPETARSMKELDSAGDEMTDAEKSLADGRMQLGHRHGNRAHRMLLSASESLEDSYRKLSGNEIRRLAETARQLSEKQRDASQASRELAARDTVERDRAERARQLQQKLGQATRELKKQIGNTAPEVGESYPAVSEALVKALRKTEEQGLSSKMTRAENALLYQRFGRAVGYQVDSANILTQLSSELASASELLPSASREELLNALNKIRQAQRQVGEAMQTGETESKTRAQLDKARGNALRGIDRIQAMLNDPRLQQISDELAMPGASENIEDEAGRLMAVFRAASAVLEKHLLKTQIEKILSLSRRTSDPPEKYRELVEEYFKMLSREKK